MRAAVDVMGGDKAPAAILKGMLAGGRVPRAGRPHLQLIGDETICREGLAAAELSAEHKQYSSKSSPRRKLWRWTTRRSNRSAASRIAASPSSARWPAKGETDIVISAGNTGACVAGAQLRMRTLPGVSRPGIAVTVPTFYGPVVICDVGANVSAQAKASASVRDYGQASYAAAVPQGSIIAARWADEHRRGRCQGHVAGQRHTQAAARRAVD